jgi:hypothetical protein
LFAAVLLFAGEIFEDIIRFSGTLKLVLPTNKVGLAFELAVVFDLVHLGVSHVWGLGSVIIDHLSQFKA